MDMWFKEITGKAEHFLDKIDKSTATVLQKSPIKKVKSSSSMYNEKTSDVSMDIAFQKYSSDRSDVDSKSSNYEDNLSDDQASVRSYQDILDSSQTEETNSIQNVSLDFVPQEKVLKPPVQVCTDEFYEKVNASTENSVSQDQDLDVGHSLKAKDSQIAILRVRLHEADEKINGLVRQLEKETQSSQKLFDDYTQASLLHTQTQASLKDKLEELETILKREQEANMAIKTSYLKQQGRLEEEKLSLTESYHELQRKITTDKSLIKELNNQLKLTQSNLNATMQELEDYKNKAKSVLHSKEKIISTLQTSPSPENQQEINEQLTLTQKRCSLLNEQLEKTEDTITALRAELQAMETNSQIELGLMEQELLTKNQELSLEKGQRDKLEFDLEQQKQSVQYYQDDYALMKSKLQLQIRDRELEIEKLRKQLTTKALNSSSQEELEVRLHNLTEALIEKQTFVETLLTEKSSLRLQIDKLKQKLDESPSTVIQFPESGLKQRSPINEPTQGYAMTKVRRAYGVVDKLSLKMGIFLRRYPAARLMVLLYMLILHVWVFIVLFTYTPEVHL